MPATLYVARFPGPFAALVQETTLGGMRLEPLPVARVRDVYWDTPTGGLLRAGLALRVRETETGERLLTLRPMQGASAPLLDRSLPPGDGPPPLDAPLRSALEGVLGADSAAAPSLEPLVTLRQFRTPRIAFDGPRAAALLSLDVVVSTTGTGTARVSNEAKVEAAHEGGPADLIRLDPALRGHGLEPVTRSKLERALLALVRPPEAPLLLLPDERDALAHLAEHADPERMRRAQALLADADGAPLSAVAATADVPVARVEQWKAQFAARRLDAFAAPATRAYRVSELVGATEEPALRRVPEAARARLHTLVPTGGDGDGLAAFLDQFAPADPETPLFAVAELDADAGASLSESRASVPPTEPGASAGTKPGRKPASPREAPASGESESDGPVGGGDRAEPRPEPDEVRKGAALTGAFPLRIHTDTPLVAAAAQVLETYVGAYGAAAQRLAAAPTARAALRVLVAAHRVRLALATFSIVVPASAADRLVAGLRPVAVGLDRALDADRASLLGTEREEVLLASRDAALAAVLVHLSGEAHHMWHARALRLVERIQAQADDGVLVSDDAPMAPEGWIGAREEAPMPSRVGHMLGSVLWRQYESVLAFERAVRALPGAPPEQTAETAYGLAAAASGVLFVLGLVAPAAPEAAQAAGAILAAAESQLAASRHRAVAQRLAGREVDEPLNAALLNAWSLLCGDALRTHLARAIAG